MTVLGYASATSVTPGRTIDVHLKHEGRSATVDLVLENVGDPSTSLSLNVDLDPDTGPTTSDPVRGFGWPTTTTIAIPSTWPSGLYTLRHGDHQVLNFVVRARGVASTSKVLVHISYLTPAAYNDVGGASFYHPADNSARARKVSLDRPESSPDLSQRGNVAGLVKWLHGEEIPVEYCSSIDLHTESELLGNYDCLILAYHDEYWTKAMRDHCERFVQDGGNLIVLSGNTCYRQVRLEDRDRTVVFYKFAGLDDPSTPLDEVAVAWAEPPVNRPQNSMLGVGFTEGAFGFGEADYTIRLPDHWVFEGVDASAPVRAIHYETDAAAYVDEPEGHARVTGDEQTPLGTTILATADLRDWRGKPGRATMTIHSRNGTVFNAATTDWCHRLGTIDAVDRITRNVIDRLRTRRPRQWEHVGHANRGRALAAVDGRLFIATERNELWRRHPVGGDVAWSKVGHANDVIAMAGTGNELFCVTGDNRLWRRPAVDVEADWRADRSGPAEGTRALAAVGGMLYAIDQAGCLQQRATDGEHATGGRDGPWREVETLHGRSLPPTPTITAMTSFGDILIAATSDGRLLRTNTDWINESDDWVEIHPCEGAVGLAMVEWMLFVATSDHRLWRMDLWALSRA